MTDPLDLRTFTKFAGIAAILSVPFAWACLVLGGVATGFDERAFTDPRAALELADPGLTRLSWFCDVVGFYFLIVPSTLAIRRWIAVHRPMTADLVAVAGITYSVIGAVGAAIHAGADPYLIERFASATEAERESLVTLRLLVERTVNLGIWQYGSMTAGGLFWAAAGALLFPWRPVIGGLGALTGLVTLLVPLGGLIGSEPVWSTALVAYFLLAPVFALVVGIQLLRG